MYLSFTTSNTGSVFQDPLAFDLPFDLSSTDSYKSSHYFAHCLKLRCTTRFYSGPVPVYIIHHSTRCNQYSLVAVLTSTCTFCSSTSNPLQLVATVFRDVQSRMESNKCLLYPADTEFLLLANNSVNLIGLCLLS